MITMWASKTIHNSNNSQKFLSDLFCSIRDNFRKFALQTDVYFYNYANSTEQIAIDFWERPFYQLIHHFLKLPPHDKKFQWFFSVKKLVPCFRLSEISNGFINLASPTVPINLLCIYSSAEPMISSCWCLGSNSILHFHFHPICTMN